MKFKNPQKWGFFCSSEDNFSDGMIFFNKLMSFSVNELIAPQGSIANIVEPGQAINLDKLAHKSAVYYYQR